MSAVVETRQAGSVPASIDLALLLKPIEGANPSGENVQYSGIYDEIREARRSDDGLTKGDWEHEAKSADWAKVIELSVAALTNQTKDLLIGSWLVEALVHVHGFVGLRDGLKLITGFHEQFWDSLYPEIEDGDFDARANAISAMETRVEIPLKSVPITKSGGGVDYSFLQWEDSTKYEIPDNLDSLDTDAYNRFTALKEEAEAGNKTTGAAFRKAKDSTRRAFYEETFILLNECREEFQKLDRVMDEKFGRQTPGLGTLKKTLEAIRDLIERLVKEKRILEPDPVLDSQVGEATGEQNGQGAGGALRGRAEALRQLAEVAEYFQRTEPHSPVAYLIQRAIKWGHMPLEVWLEEVIKDGSVLGQLKETLGMGVDTSQHYTGEEEKS